VFPIFAGTAVEHMAKACLAQRLPVLLLDLRSNSSFNWLVALLHVKGAGVPANIRTVGLREALDRVRQFVRSKANRGDLDTLVDMRNGVVHSAENAEVEERILTAFVQQADSLVADLGREREDFWDGQLAVVNALLADASNKVQHRVQVRIAAAEAMLNRRYETEGEAVIRALAAFSKSAPLTRDQQFRDCPVCGSDGIATGEYDFDVNFIEEEEEETGSRHVGAIAVDDYDEEPVFRDVAEEVWFTARRFHCPVCNLRLDSEAEIGAAGIDARWQIEDANWIDYEPPYDEADEDYVRRREERGGL
jgi:hypothetical protein